ncbi:MAG: methyltransferase domain-containing protein [Rhodospirillaceae bacterium]
MDGLKLHIGGTTAKAGWSILNIQPGPGVDYVGSATDLSAIDDASCAEVYASHVLEHLAYDTELPQAMKEIHRVLKPGGRVRVAVPDLSVICRLFASPQSKFKDRYELMRMMFGGQTDEHDFHYAGLWPAFLDALLREAGFTNIERVSSFGEFKDASEATHSGERISLNMQAYKQGV